MTLTLFSKLCTNYYLLCMVSVYVLTTDLSKVIWYIHLIDFMHINVHENKLIWPKLMTLHPVNRGYIYLNHTLSRSLY